MLETIDRISIEDNLLDDQHYLLWKDSINALSLDPDREDKKLTAQEYLDKIYKEYKENLK